MTCPLLFIEGYGRPLGAQCIMESLLQTIVDTGSEIAIIDITGG